MNHEGNAYGIWPLVVLNSLIIIIFAFSFTKPKRKRDWKTFGAFSAFIVALFVEMYGFPLTIFLLSGWLQTQFPQLDIFSHQAGHLWWSLLGFDSDPHLNPVHILANILTLAGFLWIGAAWKVLHQAQRTNTLATGGPYGIVRHPQYVGFVAVMTGFLLMWPTILTLIMFPILVTMYVKLAKREEKEVRDDFGTMYDNYAARTPAWLPKFTTS